MKRIAVLGAGGMGTALAFLFARSARTVTLWPRSRERAEEIASSRRNDRHLPGVLLPDLVQVMANPCDATAGADLIVAAIPSAYLRATLAPLSESLPPGVPVLSVIKGLEDRTFARPSQIIKEMIGDRSVAVLSGPSHAEELVRGLPASVVVAGDDDTLNLDVQNALSGETIRVYTNPDALGVELAGALKNILGIAAGICDGLRLGDNAKASMVTRGLVEISRFAVSLGAHAETFQGLAGVGDVVTTCYSPFGRNRRFGERIGQGESTEAILADMVNVAEGVPSTRSVYGLAQARGVEMPITDALYRVLFEGKPPLNAVNDLMNRQTKDEWQP